MPKPHWSDGPDRGPCRQLIRHRNRTGPLAQRAAFRPGLALTVQAAAALATVLALAAWQLARGLEKSALAEERRERLSAPPVAVAPEAAADFARLALAGRYDTQRHFLVASRRGSGFAVWTPLRTATGSVLVNRGHSADAAFETPAEPVAVRGVAWPRAPAPAAAAAWPADWPKRIGTVDLERMAAAVSAAPREVRLLPDSAGVLLPPTLAWDYSPGTHYGYVAQWLLIGAAVVAGYVVVGRRRARGANPRGGGRG